MTKILVLIVTLLTFNSSVLYAFDSSTEEKINSIFWLTPDDSRAIIYARFELFKYLRNTIANTIMMSNNTKTTPNELEQADKLLLMLPSESQIIEVYLLSSAISYEGFSYEIPSEVINKLKRINNNRVKKGDLISPKVLSIAKSRFGLPQAV